MSEYIHTGLYHLDTRSVSFDVAHIYEHLLLETFKQSLGEHGFSKYLFGWIGGETFRNVMFIEYGFYDPSLIPVFDAFICSHKRIDISLLDLELTRIEAEDLSVTTTFDRAEVIRQLRQLDDMSFVNHKDEFKPTHQDETDDDATTNTIAFQKSKRDFREIAISFGIQTMDLQDKQAFLRLRPIIIDAVDEALFAAGAYARDSSLPVGKSSSGALAVLALYDLRRGRNTTKELTANIKTALEKLRNDIVQHPEAFHHYINGFVGTPNWHTFPIDYYRYTGILTSKRAIAKTLTSGFAASLLECVEFKVETATPKHKSIVSSYS